MPTNRTRRTRTRIGCEIEAHAHYFDRGYLLAGRQERAAAAAERFSFWKKYRQEIIDFCLAENRAAGRAGKRPFPFWDEIEAEKPRRKIGVETWIGPIRPDGGDRTIKEDIYEDDDQYLARLGLLEPWEIEIINKKDNTNHADKSNANATKAKRRNAA